MLPAALLSFLNCSTVSCASCAFVTPIACLPLAPLTLPLPAWSSSHLPLPLQDARVRLASVTALLSLYANPDNKPALQDFTARFQQRFGELFYDRDEAVAVKGVSEHPGRQAGRHREAGRLRQWRQIAWLCDVLLLVAVLCFAGCDTPTAILLLTTFSCHSLAASRPFLPAGAAQHAAGAAQGGAALPVCSGVRAAR